MLSALLSVFQSPEGRTENSRGLEAWENLRKENRPESTSSPPRGRLSPTAFRKDCLTRAADFWALFPKVTFVESDSSSLEDRSRRERLAVVRHRRGRLCYTWLAAANLSPRSLTKRSLRVSRKSGSSVFLAKRRFARWAST
jgi:hypothetical protein